MTLSFLTRSVRFSFFLCLSSPRFPFSKRRTSVKAFSPPPYLRSRVNVQAVVFVVAAFESTVVAFSVVVVSFVAAVVVYHVVHPFFCCFNFCCGRYSFSLCRSFEGRGSSCCCFSGFSFGYDCCGESPAGRARGLDLPSSLILSILRQEPRRTLQLLPFAWAAPLSSNDTTFPCVHCTT